MIQSDTNCEAGKEGISRCHNEIKLDHQDTITVINIHNMNNYACFNQGDKMKVEKAAEGWIKVTKI